MRTMLLAALVMTMAACGATASAQQLVTLPSGKQLKVLGVGKILFSNDTPALMLKYQTEISLDNKDALTKEVDEIWNVFRFDVEKAELTNGIVSANEKPIGFIVTTNKSFNFVYKRGPDGQWSRLSP